MASELLSSIISGGGGVPRLEPDLNFPSVKDALNINKRAVISVSGGVPSVFFSLVGKFAIPYIRGITMTDCTNVKLTVDGEVIWNDAVTAGNNNNFLGSGGITDIPISCNDTAELEATFSTAGNREFNFVARPIK